MKERGKTIRAVGPYYIAELVEVYLDGTRDVLGYNVIGPGADSSWLHTEDEAHAALDRFVARDKPSPLGP